jgi:hypothetical protein
MPIFSRLIFYGVQFSARRGLRGADAPVSASQQQQTPAQEKFQQTEKARRFLSDCRINAGPARFDVLGIDNVPGHPPKARLHKDAFSPQLRR